MFKRALIYILLFVLLSDITAFAYVEPDISAESAVAVDAATGEVLFEKSMYNQMPMASTTKIMTCLLACEYGGFNRVVTVSEEMLKGTEGTLLYLKAGDKITFNDLIRGALIASGNDAANAIACTVSGSIDSFVLLMNEKAQSLGMKNTSFKTPSGLDSKGHYSCAYDMARLTCEALRNSAFKSIVSMKSAEISVNGKRKLLYNHNKLLSRDGNFIGVKTGFTKRSGRCLAGAYSFGGAVIVTVTLNAPDDWDDHLRLVNYSKKKYNVKTAENEALIPCADGGSVRCRYSCKVNSCSGTYVKLYYYPFIYSPYKSGDKVGYVKVYSNNAVLAQTDLIIV